MLFFITATGTHVGKTVVSALLAKEIAKQASNNKPPVYFKPVQTGPANEDSSVVQKHSNIHCIPSLYHYPDPLSPDQAHKATKNKASKAIQAQKIIDKICKLKKQHSTVICEGAGGLHVPLNTAAHTWLDILTAIDASIIVVAESGLGTLNHTALTLKSLEAHGLKELCVVFNGKKHTDNAASLKRMFPQTSLLTLEPLDVCKEASVAKAATSLSSSILKLHKDYDQKEQEQNHITRKLDQQYCWHPYTQHKTANPPQYVKKAQGVWWTMDDGRKIMDGISSWWVSILGHGRPEIASCLANQQQLLDHVLYGGVAHKEASKFAARLIKLNKDSEGNKPFSKVFYSDNGSTAVEVALKMALAYSSKHRKINHQAAPHVLSLNQGYHGDTLWAMSAGKNQFHSHTDSYNVLAPQITLHPHLAHTSFHASSGSIKPSYEDNLKEVDRIFRSSHRKVYAMIMEPILQGAGGMLIQNQEWTKHVLQKCKHYDIPVIFDEVFTGYGRLGTPFAWQTLGVAPDILCTSKGLTAGTLPLATTLTNEKIYSTFFQDHKDSALAHGHTFTANPLACRVANCVLDIIEKENVFANVSRMENTYKDFLLECRENDIPLFASRCIGSVLAFELFHPEADHPNALAKKCAEEALKYDLFIRPLESTVYLAPPLNITKKDHEIMCELLKCAIEDTYIIEPSIIGF